MGREGGGGVGMGGGGYSFLRRKIVVGSRVDEDVGGNERGGREWVGGRRGWEEWVEGGGLEGEGGCE